MTFLQEREEQIERMKSIETNMRFYDFVPNNLLVRHQKAKENRPNEFSSMLIESTHDVQPKRRKNKTILVE